MATPHCITSRLVNNRTRQQYDQMGQLHSQNSYFTGCFCSCQSSPSSVQWVMELHNQENISWLCLKPIKARFFSNFNFISHQPTKHHAARKRRNNYCLRIFCQHLQNCEQKFLHPQLQQNHLPDRQTDRHTDRRTCTTVNSAKYNCSIQMTGIYDASSLKILTQTITVNYQSANKCYLHNPQESYIHVACAAKLLSTNQSSLPKFYTRFYTLHVHQTRCPLSTVWYRCFNCDWIGPRKEPLVGLHETCSRQVCHQPSCHVKYQRLWVRRRPEANLAMTILV